MASDSAHFQAADRREGTKCNFIYNYIFTSTSLTNKSKVITITFDYIIIEGFKAGRINRQPQMARTSQKENIIQLVRQKMYNDTLAQTAQDRVTRFESAGERTEPPKANYRSIVI